MEARSLPLLDHKAAHKTQTQFCAFCAFCDFCGSKRGGWSHLRETTRGRTVGAENLMRKEWVPVEIFFLNKSHRHHSILLETAIEFAAVDSECGCRSHLVAAKLMQH